MKTSGAHQTAAVEDIVQREGGGGLRLRADYRAFPSQACISQIDNVAGLGDQPGDFHMKRCFPSEINDCYYSLTFFFPCLELTASTKIVGLKQAGCGI